MNVRAGVRLTVRPKRTTSRGSIRFLGRCAVAPIARDSKSPSTPSIAAAAAVCPSRWSAPTSRGRFRFRYRFARTFAPFTYRFIAKYERQATFPYAAGTSPVATVRVVK